MALIELPNGSTLNTLLDATEQSEECNEYTSDLLENIEPQITKDVNDNGVDRINTETYTDTRYDTYNYIYKTTFSYKNPLNSPSAFIVQNVVNILSKELK